MTIATIAALSEDTFQAVVIILLVIILLAVLPFWHR
jgi:hypothetical protein